jgi:hypothetical protein
MPAMPAWRWGALPVADEESIFMAFRGDPEASVHSMFLLLTFFRTLLGLVGHVQCVREL